MQYAYGLKGYTEDGMQRVIDAFIFHNYLHSSWTYYKCQEI